ncbi:NF-kappa-B inhibitor zeta [Myripristis murdjan]|uniref:NF-kappa-B inhibitor zeta n=1 Tax=Myripristis murdjan TaxID=586833 RepID=UPI0011761125|nr:NF-kappa-B inhibitor zeta-like [Myripristis murdjan]
MVGLDGRKKKGPKYSNCDGERRYLGVRVKMPVKDMLRSIRLAQGWDPQDIQESNGKRSKAGKKRVYTCAERRISRRKPPTKSLEELAIIVEVLEEDLKTGNTCSSLPRLFSPSTLPLSPECSPEPDNRWGPEPHVYSCSLESEPERQMSRTTELGSLSSPSDEYNNSSYYHHLQSISPHQGAGYNSDESDEMIPSPQYYMSYSPGTAEYPHTFSPPHSVCASLQPSSFDLYQDRNTGRDGGRAATQEEWVCPQNQSWNLNSATFFWTQLQREESQLRDVSDSVLLATDAHGRTVLHKVVCLGRRALGYAIAKRMAALNSLDIKDSQGMTALHLAAKQNQHLIVADLIHLGANINERDRSGKTCLHLSAENGYIRVLEVLKHMMKDGIYLDVEATDKYGMSVFQCTSLALTATVRELERSTCPSESRLHTLRKEQLMETLECLLQMSSYLQTASCCYGENAFDVSYKKESDQLQELVSKSNLKKGELCNVGLCLPAQQGIAYWRPDSNVSELIQA